MAFSSLPAWGYVEKRGKLIVTGKTLWQNKSLVPLLNLFFVVCSADSRRRSLYNHLCSSITWDGRSWRLLPLQWGKDKISWRSIWWGAAKKALDRKLQDGWDFWWIQQSSLEEATSSWVNEIYWQASKVNSCSISHHPGNHRSVPKANMNSSVLHWNP